MQVFTIRILQRYWFMVYFAVYSKAYRKWLQEDELRVEGEGRVVDELRSIGDMYLIMKTSVWEIQ